MNGPLSGYRVIDLSQAGSGPFGSMFLADLGAEVIKIEIGRGDVTRGSPGANHKGESYHFLALNRNKKSVLLNLKTKAGKEAFYDLIRVSDVAWDNYRAGVLARLGADHESLKKINPRIVSCSISGYGESGPYRDRPSWDPVVSALTGLTSLIGEPDRPPLWPGIAFVDLVGGLVAALATVSALAYRDKTGIGSKVEVPLMNTAISLLAHFATRYFLSGEISQRMGSMNHTSIPFGVFPTKEGYISLGPCWPRICRALDAEWLIDDPRFKDLAGRVENGVELTNIISELFQKLPAEDWLNILYAEDIPAAPVNSVDKAVSDPQVLHNDMVITVPHSLGGEFKMVGSPIRISGLDRKENQAAPTLGQHTREVLSGLLNYSEDRIRQLEEETKASSDHRGTSV